MLDCWSSHNKLPEADAPADGEGMCGGDEGGCKQPVCTRHAVASAVIGASAASAIVACVEMVRVAASSLCALGMLLPVLSLVLVLLVLVWHVWCW